MSEASEAELMVEICEHFEGSWAGLRANNAAICASSHSVQTDSRHAFNHCNAVSNGSQHLQDELKMLPGTIKLMRDMSTRAANLFSRFEALEERLSSLTVKRTHERERAWRLRRLAEVEHHEEVKRREAQRLERLLSRFSREEETAEQAERRGVFETEFESQRQQVLEHGMRDPDFQVMKPMAERQQSHERPKSLAEVLPGLLPDEGELDDFYNVEVVPLDEGPTTE